VRLCPCLLVQHRSQNTGDNCPLNKIGPGTVVAKDLQSSIPTATEWLRRCDTSHEKCRPARPAHLPHRVIDVGELGLRDSLEADPVLYESHGEEAKYIALSHCWGKAPIIRTTLNTVSSRLKRIKWDSLSKTFQDAIIITRLLCIRYLWIDSLCIIQDDPNDWRQEAALMASIYGEAYLTISASNSTNGSGGCRCTPWPTFEVGEALNPAENLPFSIYARERLDHGRFKYWAKPPNPGMETDAFDDYPLMARAWCFQERLLPCRVLHFTSQELFFECKTDDWCECLNFEPRPFAEEKKPLKRFFFEILERKDTEELLKEWTQILEAYSHMDRTQDGDILVALAGIARVIGEAGLHGYFAGMWKENLAFALDWKPKIEKNKVVRHRRPSLYTAPSFSWASVIGPVQWNHNQTWTINVAKQYCPEFLEMSSTPIGTDPFGGLSAAFLKVKAPLASASIYSTDKDGISNPKLTIQGLQDPNVGTSKYDFERNKLHFDIPGACCDAIASSCIYLMQTKVEVNQIDDKKSKSNAMILKRRTDGRYERIGVAENLRIGIFKEHYGPWTEIVLV
jgi:hypothetical protein